MIQTTLPAGNVTLLHGDSCDGCREMIGNAVSIASSTGSTAGRGIIAGPGGEVGHEALWTRDNTADGLARDAAARLAQAAEEAAARRDEEDAQLERALVFASYDVDNAADMARAAGQTELADKLAGIATTLRDAMPGSFVPEGTCF